MALILLIFLALLILLLGGKLRKSQADLRTLRDQYDDLRFAKELDEARLANIEENLRIARAMLDRYALEDGHYED